MALIVRYKRIDRLLPSFACKSGHVLFLFCFCCSDALVSQILDELGLQMADQLSGTWQILCLVLFLGSVSKNHALWQRPWISYFECCLGANCQEMQQYLDFVRLCIDNH